MLAHPYSYSCVPIRLMPEYGKLIDYFHYQVAGLSPRDALLVGS
jgi:hypothetical protein